MLKHKRAELYALNIVTSTPHLLIYSPKRLYSIAAHLNMDSVIGVESKLYNLRVYSRKEMFNSLEDFL